MEEMNVQMTDSPFTPMSALCLGAMTIVAEDGEFTEEELTYLRNLVRTNESAYLSAFQFFKEHTVEECIAKVAATLTAQQKLSAFAMMVDIGYADKNFATVEQQLLDNYAGAFGISHPKADEIYRVTALRHDFSVFVL